MTESTLEVMFEKRMDLWGKLHWLGWQVRGPSVGRWNLSNIMSRGTLPTLPVDTTPDDVAAINLAVGDLRKDMPLRWAVVMTRYVTRQPDGKRIGTKKAAQILRLSKSKYFQTLREAHAYVIRDWRKVWHDPDFQNSPDL